MIQILLFKRGSSVIESISYYLSSGIITNDITQLTGYFYSTEACLNLYQVAVVAQKSISSPGLNLVLSDSPSVTS